jgi:hypothetical protein
MNADGDNWHDFLIDYIKGLRKLKGAYPHPMWLRIESNIVNKDRERPTSFHAGIRGNRSKRFTSALLSGP